MPILDLAPNPPTAETESPARITLRAGRYGEMEHHELVRLLDTLDDDRARSRFRESVYISLFVYLALAWFVFYGPRVLFHQARIIDPVAAMKQHDREMTMLDTPSDLTRQLRRQQPPPKIDQKTMERLRAMNRPAPAPQRPQPQPAPPHPTKAMPSTPLPATPEPVQQQPRIALAPAPQPNIPDAPKPSPTRPNFSQPNQTAGDAIRQAARDAARSGPGSGADTGPSLPSARGGANAGLEAISDLQGVDFEAYFKRLKREIYNSWIPLIPEEARPPLNKRGITQIRFTIEPDGRIMAHSMHLDGSTHDEAIDRAAWGSITGVGQFQPLPAAYHGPLELRFTYYVNEQPQ